MDCWFDIFEMEGSTLLTQYSWSETKDPDDVMDWRWFDIPKIEGLSTQPQYGKTRYQGTDDDVVD